MRSHRPRTESAVEPGVEPGAGTAVEPGAGTAVEPATPEWPSTREWLRERIDVQVAVGVGVAWIVLTQIVAAVEPAPQESEPLIGTVLAWSMIVLLLATLGGLALRRRWGLVASLGGAVLATAAAVACPVSGHHAFGLWWLAEMVCVLGLVGVSVAALHMSSPSHR